MDFKASLLSIHLLVLFSAFTFDILLMIVFIIHYCSKHPLIIVLTIHDFVSLMSLPFLIIHEVFGIHS